MISVILTKSNCIHHFPIAVEWDGILFDLSENDKYNLISVKLTEINVDIYWTIFPHWIRKFWSWIKTSECQLFWLIDQKLKYKLCRLHWNKIVKDVIALYLQVNWWYSYLKIEDPMHTIQWIWTLNSLNITVSKRDKHISDENPEITWIITWNYLKTPE